MTTLRHARRGGLGWAVVVLVGALFVSVAVLAGSAFAYFLSTDSSHPGVATAASLSPPTNPGAKAKGPTKITVSWTVPGTQLAGAQYRVTRTSPGTPVTVCTVTPPTRSCQDTGVVAATTYVYSIVAILPGTNWVSAAITASTSTTRTTPVITTVTSTTTVVVGRSVHDAATVTGGDAPTGHLTWHVYGEWDTKCSTPLLGYSSTETLGGDGTYVSGTLTPETPGQYIWGFTYAGDAHNAPVKGCGGRNEVFCVVKATPTLSTSAGSAVGVGTPLSDIATLTNGFKPTGTVTFKLYQTAWCHTQVKSAVTATVSGNGTYPSPPITPTMARTYYWTASYSGDGNNNPAFESCGSKGESVTTTEATPTITTKSSTTSIAAGNSVTDVAHLSGGYDISGTLTWHVFSSTTPVCTPKNTLFSYDGTQTVNGTGTYSPASPPTITKVGSYKWGVSYAGTTGNNKPVSLCGGTHEMFAVAPAAAHKLVFTTPPVSGPAGSSALLGPITVQERDQYTNPTTTGIRVTLASTSTGPYILNETKGATVPTGPTHLTIPGGSTSATFYYGDAKVGTPTITASHTGYASATQQEKIKGASGVRVVESATATGSNCAASATFANRTTSGDTVLILVYAESGTHGSPTVTVSGTSLSGPVMAVATETSKATTTAGYKIWAYRATANGSSHKTVTVNVASTHHLASFVHIDVLELAGNTTASPIRRDGVNASTIPSKTPTAALSTTPTVGDLELFFFGTSGNDGGITQPPAGTWGNISAANSSSSQSGVGSYVTTTSFSLGPTVKMKSSLNWAAMVLDVAV
jgi:hypothetical protein